MPFFISPKTAVYGVIFQESFRAGKRFTGIIENG